MYLENAKMSVIKSFFNNMQLTLLDYIPAYVLKQVGWKDGCFQSDSRFTSRLRMIFISWHDNTHFGNSIYDVELLVNIWTNFLFKRVLNDTSQIQFITQMALPHPLLTYSYVYVFIFGLGPIGFIFHVGLCLQGHTQLWIVAVFDEFYSKGSLFIFRLAGFCYFILGSAFTATPSCELLVIDEYDFQMIHLFYSFSDWKNFEFLLSNWALPSRPHPLLTFCYWRIYDFQTILYVSSDWEDFEFLISYWERPQPLLTHCVWRIHDFQMILYSFSDLEDSEFLIHIGLCLHGHTHFWLAVFDKYYFQMIRYLFSDNVFWVSFFILASSYMDMFFRNKLWWLLGLGDHVLQQSICSEVWWLLQNKGKWFEKVFLWEKYVMKR